MKKSEILRKIIPNLWDGVGGFNKKDIYVCIAIRNLKRCSYQDKQRLINDIKKMLYPTNNVIVWVSQQLHLEGIAIGTREQRQNYRLRWVRHMIKYYESIGE